MSDFLSRMEASSRERLERARALNPLERLQEKALARPTRPIPDVPFHLFAEVKPGSPSEGSLTDVDPLSYVAPYCSGGATSLSVLTEPTSFGGSLDLLQQASELATLPVMRKDFLVDPYQVWEARAWGADGVLVIARMFEPSRLQEMIESASAAGVFVLLEVFEEQDLPLVDAVDLGEPSFLLGVNCRDLQTLEVRVERHEEIAGELPEGFVTIAESGIGTVERVAELAQMGYGGVLVGTALMRGTDPAGTVGGMLRAGQRARV